MSFVVVRLRKKPFVAWFVSLVWVHFEFFLYKPSWFFVVGDFCAKGGGDSKDGFIYFPLDSDLCTMAE